MVIREEAETDGDKIVKKEMFQIEKFHCTIGIFFHSSQMTYQDLNYLCASSSVEIHNVVFP